MLEEDVPDFKEPDELTGGGGPDEGTEQPLCGYLDKQTAWTKKWTRRWVFLMGCHLSYSEDKGQPEKGSWDVSGVAPIAGDDIGFKVTTPSKDTWCFRADSVEQRDIWFQRLQQAAEAFHNTFHWKKLGATTGEVPSKRSDHTCVVINDCMYLFGGRGANGKHHNDLYTFHLVTNNWRLYPTQDPAPQARCAHTAVVCEDGEEHIANPKMYVFGGEEKDAYFADTWAFDFTTETWSELTTTGDAPAARSYHTACVYKGSMYVFGGREKDKLRRRTNDLFKLDLNTGVWKVISATADAPSPRRSHSCIVRYNCMYIFGGKGEDDDRKKNLDTTHVFDFESEQWRLVRNRSTILPALSGHHSVIDRANHQNMFVYGGRKQAKILGKEQGRLLFESKTVYKFHFEHDDVGMWSVVRCINGPPKMRKFSSIVYQGNWIVFGGMQGNSTKFNDLWSLPLSEIEPAGHGGGCVVTQNSSLNSHDQSSTATTMSFSNPNRNNDVATGQVMLGASTTSSSSNSPAGSPSAAKINVQQMFGDDSDSEDDKTEEPEQKIGGNDDDSDDDATVQVGFSGARFRNRMDAEEDQRTKEKLAQLLN